MSGYQGRVHAYEGSPQVHYEWQAYSGGYTYGGFKPGLGPRGDDIARLADDVFHGEEVRIRRRMLHTYEVDETDDALTLTEEQRAAAQARWDRDVAANPELAEHGPPTTTTTGGNEDAR